MTLTTTPRSFSATLLVLGFAGLIGSACGDDEGAGGSGTAGSGGSGGSATTSSVGGSGGPVGNCLRESCASECAG